MKKDLKPVKVKCHLCGKKVDIFKSKQHKCKDKNE